MSIVRGDRAEEALFRSAAALTRARGIESDADLGDLLAHPPPDGGPDTAAVMRRLRHMYESAAWVLVESAIADLPADLRWLFESGAVSVEQLAALHAATGATSLSDLVDAVADRTLCGVPGFDEATAATIAAALPTLRRSVGRLPLGRARALADPIIERLRATDGVAWASAAGSLRRGQETVGDVEIVAATDRPDDAIAGLVDLPDVVRCLHRSARRVFLRLERAQVGVRLPAVANAGAVLLRATGSFAHVAALRDHAAALGLRLAANGLFAANGDPRPSGTEEQLYAALGLPCIPPEIRNGGEEIDAARRGTLPPLVAASDIRGDLHMHTEFSDGRDSIEAMVLGCRRLGYEYMAITDHSPHSAASRNLSADTIARQADDIARLRERYQDIAILHGCEVDILPDGRLDFPDRILERLDIVLASLHDRAGQAPAELLRRYTMAMRHPLVTVITHPTNRIVPHRPGYDLDYDALFRSAVDTGTIVEIDGAPTHLDLEGALSRRAVAAGALVSVDSDCHRADALGLQMELGLATARRGWIEPRHVVNARPLAEMRSVIAAKRQS